MTIYQQRAALANQLAVKLAADGLSVLFTRGLKNWLCPSPFLNVALCNAFDSVIEKQTKEPQTSLLAVDIQALWWGLEDLNRRRN